MTAKTLDQSKAKEVFESLYETVNGRALSLEGRETQQLSSKSFVYGEVVFDAFYQLLKDADPQPGWTFVDCGSGTGKAVFVAHFMFDFPKSAGVELVDVLYNASAQVLENYEQNVRPTIAEEIGDKQIKFIHGSIIDIDFTNVDFVFMNSTCFQEDLMLLMEDPLNTMKPGSKVITLSKTLRSPRFEQYKQQMYEFSWGQATAFYHRKIN